MALFETSYSITNQLEGGYANDKEDKGGETYRGIARKFHPKWEGWVIVDNIKSEFPLPVGEGRVRILEWVQKLNDALDANEPLQSLIKKFYLDEFWNKIKGDLIPDQRIANEVYDNAVHMGVKKSGEYLQRTINILNRNGHFYADIKVDGDIGSKTLLALNATIKKNGARRVVNVINGYQVKHYLERMEKDPVQEKYIGWFDRVEIIWN